MTRYDYHMHPQVLGERSRAEEFIQKAVDMGLEEICITDHMPLSISNAPDRIPAGKVGEYCERIHQLAEQYRGVITIKTGIEMDYHPMFTEEIEQVLREGNFDYIIGSSHLHIGGCGVNFPSLTADGFVSMTLENILRSVKSGYFHTVAHMDLYYWIFDHPERFPLKDRNFHYGRHTEKIAEILDEIRHCGMFLEINTHRMGTTKKLADVFPCAETLWTALAKNLRFRYGSDAHAPEYVGFGRAELWQNSPYRECMSQEND